MSNDLEETSPRVGVSVSRKVNLGNYQSADIFFSLTNIDVGATRQDIEAAMETAEVVFSVVKERVERKAYDLLDEQRAALEARRERLAKGAPPA